MDDKSVWVDRKDRKDSESERWVSEWVSDWENDWVNEWASNWASEREKEGKREEPAVEKITDIIHANQHYYLSFL